MILIVKSNIISLIKRQTKKIIRHVSIYVEKIIIFDIDHEINLFIRHRFLLKNNECFFESISQFNIVIDQLIIKIQTMIEND